MATNSSCIKSRSNSVEIRCFGAIRPVYYRSSVEEVVDVKMVA